MVDLGDLREGVMHKEAVEYVGDILKLRGVNLIGIGTNLTCLSGVLASKKNLGILNDIRNYFWWEFK